MNNENQDAPQEVETPLSKQVKELKAMFRDDLQSIIDFVSGTDSEVANYVRELKRQWK